MFVRTRPKDNARVVVTKVEADKIDEEWTIVAGTHDIFVAEKEIFVVPAFYVGIIFCRFLRGKNRRMIVFCVLYA